MERTARNLLSKPAASPAQRQMAEQVLAELRAIPPGAGQ